MIFNCHRFILIFELKIILSKHLKERLFFFSVSIFWNKQTNSEILTSRWIVPQPDFRWCRRLTWKEFLAKPQLIPSPGRKGPQWRSSGPTSAKSRRLEQLEKTFEEQPIWLSKQIKPVLINHQTSLQVNLYFLTCISCDELIKWQPIFNFLFFLLHSDKINKVLIVIFEEFFFVLQPFDLKSMSKVVDLLLEI